MVVVVVILDARVVVSLVVSGVAVVVDSASSPEIIALRTSSSPSKYSAGSKSRTRSVVARIVAGAIVVVALVSVSLDACPE